MNESNIIIKNCSICHDDIKITYGIYRELIAQGKRLYCQKCLEKLYPNNE